jgi:predicted Zn finger-like uncharacterized protein
MLIVCPNCATSYRVEPASLGAAGRSVRCVRCRSVWFATDPSALSAVADGFRSQAMAVTAPPTAEAPPPPEAGFETDSAPPDEIAIADMPEQQPADFDVPPPEQEPLIALPEHGMLPFHGTLPGAEGSTVEADSTAEPAIDAVAGEDIETVAARRAKRRNSRRRFRLPAPGLPATILALIAINAILIGWRADVVKIAPQTASLYAAIGLPVNLRGLVFSNVATVTEAHEGVPVLVVEGSIASASNQVVEVPRLRFSVRNTSGQEVYSWTALPARSVLAPGETLAFRSRLASPPPEGRDVTVRFFNRRDRVAGIQ